MDTLKAKLPYVLGTLGLSLWILLWLIIGPALRGSWAWRATVGLMLAGLLCKVLQGVISD
jgi:hypothetical protein